MTALRQRTGPTAIKRRRRTSGARKERPAASRSYRSSAEPECRGSVVALAGEVADHRETGPPLTGGDVDADWMRAHDSGEEAVGGGVATPDQDVVDEIGRALGVAQPADAELRTSEEVLLARDRFRWHLERKAADAEDAREPSTGHGPPTPSGAAGRENRGKGQGR